MLHKNFKTKNTWKTYCIMNTEHISKSIFTYKVGQKVYKKFVTTRGAIKNSKMNLNLLTCKSNTGDP